MYTLGFIINSFYFLFMVECISFALKGILLLLAILHGLRSPKLQRPWFFLLPILVGAMFSDAAWIMFITQKIFLPSIGYKFTTFFIRLSWAWATIQYQSLSLFLESLIEKQFSIKLHQKIFLITSALLCSCYLFFAFFKFNTTNVSFESTLFKIGTFYLFGVVTPSVYKAIKKIRRNSLPKILKKQLKILIQGLIAPFLISDFIQYYPFSFFPGQLGNYAVVSVSTTFLTLAFYYCAKKIMGLRFLNFQSHVQSSSSFNFINDFKDVLEQLGHITNKKELGHITQSFFKNAFRIQPSRTVLYLRQLHPTEPVEEEAVAQTDVETMVESFINKHDTETCKIATFLRQHKILITDEIEFNNFYDETVLTKELVAFLETINADVFLPIYEKNTIIAYIIVECEARPNDLYSNVERDEMVVFASYLSNIINLLQNRNLSSIIQKDKDLREELYRKHQEINQYKESIRSFLRDTKHRKIGIIFYKNKKFVFGNQAAKELISTNINTQEGHPLTKALHRLAQQAHDYKSGQTTFAKDANGNRLVLTALPNLEHNNIIIMVYYPEISDIIKGQIDLLKDPSQWDYLLYLETTQPGKLIKQLIPGTGEELLNFKVELLKAALNKKALLLEMPEQDLSAVVELLHHVSLRDTLHALKLQASEKNAEIALRLFGINAIFGMQHDQPLLEKLNNAGTLFIQNIHFLDLETQKYLAEFIKYGYYHQVRSEQKIFSNVRIICSTNQNLQLLIQEGKFSRPLFNELSKTKLSMPSLFLLPKNELSELADQFTEQAIQSQTFKTLLELTEKEKNKIINTCPASLQEFKTKVQQMLMKKSKKNNIVQETFFDPAYNITDPELVSAARLGKKALKDSQIMALLVNKFKNQNKIAAFLGVNRSSVNRRCKDYNLL